jgi:hypothetical protein
LKGAESCGRARIDGARVDHWGACSPRTFGVAWAGREGPRRRLGALLAPLGLFLFALGVVWGLIPDFFSDGVGFDGR